MSNITNEDSLRKTLELANLDIDFSKILEHKHGHSSEDRKRVHNATNELLQKSLDTNSLGECIHITGEMRALTDPFHRYICEKINQKDRDVFQVVYNLPEKYMNNPVDMIEWNLENWASGKKQRKWAEELRTIYSIANRSVNLYAFDTSNEIQYSVFGHKYILLQEKHEDKAQAKHTWLLESEELNDMLTDKGKDLIHKSKNMNEGNYRKFTQNLSSVASKRYYTLLKDKESMSENKLLMDEVANDFCDSPQEIIKSLKAMKFIDIDVSNKIKITSEGREFFYGI